MKNTYIPRHAGGTDLARILSSTTREQVDFERAAKLLKAQVERGNTSAVVLQVRLDAYRLGLTSVAS